MDSGISPPEPRKSFKWTEQARRSFKVWHNYHPSIAYARGDPHTFDVPIDRAADMAGVSQDNFYKCYLQSGRLPYEVKIWWHGRKRRRKSFIPRAALMELLARDLLEAARRQLLKRRPRPPAISRRSTTVDLEREMELRYHRPKDNPK
jgi:hypothetical protein